MDMIVQPDGKILIAGGMGKYDATPCLRLARLNADGTLDHSFVNTANVDWGVNCIALQTDGKVLAGGPFTTFGGSAHNRIVRLLTDGSADPSFSIGTGFDGEVRRILVQPNGRIVVAGAFTSYNGTPCAGMCRLLSNGTYDPSFNVGSGPTGGVHGSVLALVRLPSGQFLACGDFSAFNGVARANIALLNTDGSVSNAFVAPGNGPDGWVLTAEMVGTDRIVLGGFFMNYGNTTAQHLVKVDLTGAVDATFNTAAGFNGMVQDLAVQSDGKVIAVGNFGSYAGTVRGNIARIDTDGSLDNGFNTTPLPAPYAWSVAVKADGKVLMGIGDPTPGRKNLVQLLSNGTPDLNFARATGITGEFGCSISTILRRSDGHLIVSGLFDQVWNTARPSLACLNPDGTLDPSFDPGTGGGSINDLALQADDKLVLGGNFISFNGTAVGRIVRLLTSGAIDPGFATGTGFNGAVAALAVQPDGRILVAGNFTQYNGTTCPALVRLMPNGALDGTFAPGVAPNTIQRVVLQADGRVLVSGSFTTFNGVARARIARLQANGTMDTGFDPGTGPNGYVDRMVVRPDGRVLIHGGFSTVNSTARPGLARLLADGSFDPSFAPQVSSVSRDIILQPNGKLIVITLNSFMRRLHPDGDLDLTFSGPSTSNMFSLLIQPDGSIIVGGNFTTIGGFGRNRIARLYNGDPVVNVSVKALLEGPYDAATQRMGDGLRTSSLIPNAEPYTALGFDHVASGGGESVQPNVLTVSGADAIVDWVVLELRSSLSTRVATRAALIQRDGDVVDLDGTSPVAFPMPVGNYYVAIRHRNHLGALTAAPVALTGTATVVDLTASATTTYGTEARKTIGTRMVLWAGNALRDTRIQYTGTGNDRDPLFIAIGGVIPTNTVTGYMTEDITMDGVVKYVGANNDRDPILVNVGGITPNNVRTEQVP